MWTLIIGALLILVVGSCLAYLQNEANVASAKKDLAKVRGYDPALVQSLGYNQPSISIDPNTSHLAITLPGRPPRLLHFNEIVSAEVEKNGRSLTKTNRGSQAAGAAVGAVLLGPAGLLLGGLTGSSRIEETVKQVTLKIYTNDLISPVITIHFLNSWTSVKADSFIVKQAARSADEWYGRLCAILQRRQIGEGLSAPSPTPMIPTQATTERTYSESRQEEIDRRLAHKRLRRIKEAQRSPQLDG